MGLGIFIASTLLKRTGATLASATREGGGGAGRGPLGAGRRSRPGIRSELVTMDGATPNDERG